MPIRIEHQPSPYAVGMAGYAVGRGAAKARQQKYALDLFQQDRQNQMLMDREDQRQQWMDDREAKRHEKQAWLTPPALTPVPDFADPLTRRDLMQQGTAIRSLHSEGFDYNDPAVREKERELRERYESTIAGIKPPDTAEQARRGMVWYNPDNPSEFSGTENPGWIATQGHGFDPASVAADKANRQQTIDKESERQEKERRSAAQSRLRDRLTLEGLTKEDGTPRYTSDQIQSELDKVYGPDDTQQPIVVGPGMAAQPVPIPPPAAPAAGAPGGAAVREGGVMDLSTTYGSDLPPLPTPAELGIPEAPELSTPQSLGIDVPPTAKRIAEVMPKITAGMQQQRREQLTPELLRKARRIAQTPAGAAALKERYGVDFSMPEEQQQAAFGPQARGDIGTARQHVEAMRGPQGTGEGKPSDRQRLEGELLGSGSTTGRMARASRDELGPGQTRTTKYNVAPTAAEREAAMNERYNRAVRMQEEREIMARASGRDPSGVAPGAKPSLGDPMTAEFARIQREDEMAKRGNAVATREIGKGIDRAQRLGKSSPVVLRAVQAALSGDVAAQKALDERGIRWRT